MRAIKVGVEHGARLAAPCVGLVALLGAEVAANGEQTPMLTQLAGTAGCVSDNGSGGCASAIPLMTANHLVVSPDGLHVYVVSSGGITIYDRNLETGALAQKLGPAGCYTNTGNFGFCGDGMAIGSAGIAVSPDGRSLYVTSLPDDAVAVFERAWPSGGIGQNPNASGCASSTVVGCTDTVALGGAWGVAVSPDGRNVYVAALEDDAVVVFDRAPATGAITQKMGTAGCIQETGSFGCADGHALGSPAGVAVSPDGANVYVTSPTIDSLAIFSRNPLTGAIAHLPGIDGCYSETGSGGICRNGRALDVPWQVAVSPDGRHVYVASQSSNGVAVFARGADGALLQPAGTDGCISETVADCADGVGLTVANDVALSPDGGSVYVSSSGSNAVSVFDRNPTTGALEQKSGVAACLSETGAGGCADGRALAGAFDVAVSPDGRTVYAAAPASDAVAVLDRIQLAYDIDGDGATEPLTDGLLLLRFLFGFTGTPLIAGAVDVANCTRCTAPLIEAYIAALQP
jgi:DNA-binding beta-propeller fold protein YncE